MSKPEIHPACPKCGCTALVFEYDLKKRNKMFFSSKGDITYRPYTGYIQENNKIDPIIYCHYCDFTEEDMTPEGFIEKYPECKKEMV